MEIFSKKKNWIRNIIIIFKLFFVITTITGIFYLEKFTQNTLFLKIIITFMFLQILRLLRKIKILEIKIEFIKTDVTYRLQKYKKEKT